MIHLLALGRMAPVTGLAENVTTIASLIPYISHEPIQALQDRAQSVEAQVRADASGIGQYRNVHTETYPEVKSEIEQVVARIEKTVPIPWYHGNQQVARN